MGAALVAAREGRRVLRGAVEAPEARSDDAERAPGGLGHDEVERVEGRRRGEAEVAAARRAAVPVGVVEAQGRSGAEEPEALAEPERAEHRELEDSDVGLVAVAGGERGVGGRERGERQVPVGGAGLAQVHRAPVADGDDRRAGPRAGVDDGILAEQDRPPRVRVEALGHERARERGVVRRLVAGARGKVAIRRAAQHLCVLQRLVQPALLRGESDRIVHEKPPQLPGRAAPPRDAGEEGDERGAERVGQQVRLREPASAQRGARPESFSVALGQSDRAGDAVRRRPQRGNGRTGEHVQLGVRVFREPAADRGERHHGVAEPVGRNEQRAAGLGSSVCHGRLRFAFLRAVQKSDLRPPPQRARPSAQSAAAAASHGPASSTWRRYETVSTEVFSSESISASASESAFSDLTLK